MDSSKGPREFPFFVQSVEGVAHSGHIDQKTAEHHCEEMNTRAKALGISPSPKYEVVATK